MIESIFTGLTPDVPSNIDGVAYTLGTEFTPDVDGQILGVRFWSGGEVAGSYGGLYLWTSASTGSLLASKSIATTPTSSGWQEVTFDSPVDVTAGVKYVAVWGPTTDYGTTSLFFDGGDYTNDHLAASLGTYLVGSTPAFPHSTYDSSCYFIDVLFQFDSGNIDLVVQDTTQSQTVDNAVLTVMFDLVVQDATQSQTVDAVVLTEVVDLVIQDASQLQTVDAVVLTEIVDLVVQDSSQLQTVDNAVLTVTFDLVVQNADQSQTVDAVVLTEVVDLVIQDASQSQTVDNVNFTGMIDLVVQDASQSQTVDDVVLTIKVDLVVQDATQSQTVDGVALTDMFDLVVQDASQSQTVDNVVLTVKVDLVVQNANQSQTVDVVAFSSAGLIRRLELQTMLEQFVSNVYYQPPPSLSMAYPCIVYQRDNAITKFADNNPYSHEVRYQITIIDRNPDSDIPGKVAMLPKTLFNRYFAANGLNHNVFTTFY